MVKKLLKSKLINITFFLIFLIVTGYSQSKVDTLNVILTTANQYIYWKGYNNNLNDTTRLIISAIGKFNSIADSILDAKQSEYKIIYSEKIIQDYKNNFFSLVGTSKVLDSVNLYNINALEETFDTYIDKNNDRSIVECYASVLANNEMFSKKLYEVNKDRSFGAGWNTANQNNQAAFEKAMPYIGMQSGKSVTVKCGSGGVVYCDGDYGGPSGVELILFKGSHSIVVMVNGISKCRYSLLIPDEKDVAPIILNCDNSKVPCSCK